MKNELKMFSVSSFVYNLKNCGIVICDAFVALMVCWDDVIISNALKTKCGDILSTITIVILCDS
jgi:hypothetical protein